MQDKIYDEEHSVNLADAMLAIRAIRDGDESQLDVVREMVGEDIALDILSKLSGPIEDVIYTVRDKWVRSKGGDWVRLQVNDGSDVPKLTLEINTPETVLEILQELILHNS